MDDSLTLTRNAPTTLLWMLAPDVITNITTRLPPDNLLFLWNTNQVAMQKSLAKNVTSFTLNPNIHAIRMTAVILATKFRNLRKFCGEKIDSRCPLDWTNMSPDLRSVTLWADNLILGLFQPGTHVHFPKLSTLRLLSGLSVAHVPNAVLPPTLTKLELFNSWGMYPFGGERFSACLLPPHLTSAKLFFFDTVLVRGVWPSTLSKLHVSGPKLANGLELFLGDLPPSLTDLCLDFPSTMRSSDTRTSVIQASHLVSLPPALINLRILVCRLEASSARDIFRALPRSLTLFMLADMHIGEGVPEDAYEALPPNLKTLSLDLVARTPGASAKLPRSLTDLCITHENDMHQGVTSVSCLQYLPYGLRTLNLMFVAGSTFSPDPQDVYFRHLTRFSDLVNLTIACNYSPTFCAVHLTNLPSTLVRLEILGNLTKVSGDDDQDATTTNLVPKSVTTLAITTILLTPKWWSLLPNVLKNVDITTPDFGLDELVAMSSTCPNLQSTKLSITRKATFGAMTTFVSSIPQSQTIFIIHLHKNVDIIVENAPPEGIALLSFDLKKFTQPHLGIFTIHSNAYTDNLKKANTIGIATGCYISIPCIKGDVWWQGEGCE